MVKREEVDPTKHIGIRVENIIRRTDFNNKGWPEMSGRDTVVQITMRGPKAFAEYHSL